MGDQWRLRGRASRRSSRPSSRRASPRALVVRAITGGLAVVAMTRPAAPSVGAASAVIQPGARITMGGLGCTAGWVFAGDRKLRGVQFIATAGHCVSGAGESVYLTDGPFPVSSAPGRLIGQVAYASRTFDFALVRIARGNLTDVVPSVAGHPDIPAAPGGGSSRVGDLCQFSGHGVPFDVTTTTAQSRAGVVTDVQPDDVYCTGPAYEGDSGGPLADVTAGNTAIGIVDGVDVTVGGAATDAGIKGVSLAALVADAARHGFPIHLRTVGH